MSGTVICVNNLSKAYQLGVINHGMLSKDIQSWWARVRGKEDPNSIIGMYDKGQIDSEDRFWALRDIDFEIRRGDRIGIIGKNGAGKSTLLKILSRVTAPTKGGVRVNGRIASLLEVGTGFHPELTGRENVYLNGAILGMTKHEIRKKFDEIVDFSGVEKFIDTPVKRYSSGMYVRLAFAVAAHLEPEILVVDEVLAVGDAEFQKKALGKMENVSKGGGRTIIFVSHNMTAIKQLCNKGILLEQGIIKKNGDSSDVIDTYINGLVKQGMQNNFWEYNDAPGENGIKVKSAYVRYTGEKITTNTPFEIVTEFWNNGIKKPLNVSTVIYDSYQNPVFNIIAESSHLSNGLYRSIFFIPSNLMNDGIYNVQNIFVADRSVPLFVHYDAHKFEIFDDRDIPEWHGKWIGAVRPTFIKSSLLKI